ncbi:MAG: hypothetical protein AB7S26_02480 [Sandaracinaceae bacterium]
MSLDVDIPTPERDAPRPLTLVAVGAVMLGCGLAIARWGMDADRSSTGSSSSATPPAAIAPREPLDVEPSLTVEATDADPDTASDRTITHGPIAYLRCDGVPHATGACPRDEPLEAAVRAALERVATCAEAPAQPGWVDVRVDYRLDAAPDVSTRDTFAPDIARTDAAAVLACVREPLASTRQTLGAERMIVSFRFALQ